MERAPSRTARRTLLRILSGTARAESRLVVRLGRVHPPVATATSFAGMLALFRERHAEDERTIMSLERRWNAQLVERQARRDRLVNLRLERRCRSIGVGSCASYFKSLRS